MPYQALINFAHKRTLRRLWDGVPTVDAVRKTMLDADRLGSVGRKRVLLSAPIDLTASSPSAVTHAERGCMIGPNAWPFTERHHLRGTPDGLAGRAARLLLPGPAARRAALPGRDRRVHRRRAG